MSDLGPLVNCPLCELLERPFVGSVRMNGALVCRECADLCKDLADGVSVLLDDPPEIPRSPADASRGA